MLVNYFNFYPNSEPDMVYEAYQYGLLAQVYPANNLLESSRFPKEFIKAVQTFKSNCLKGKEMDLFIKTTSTIICRENEEEYACPANQPFHYIQVGSAKEKIYSPSQAIKPTLEKNDLRELVETKLLILINKLFGIQEEDKLKVNLATTHALMIYYSKEAPCRFH
ncbi:hypothetical protein DCAR_0726829 [Daucus carota subsp. sativus]|uniref:Uncharacterized protein n=1 Tax=Daucus carota subsp. sativus TaxID=79200 RepID=A0A164SKT8_DAUCS|nr:hypothetical protein DCAR_0726829 [Daucus carota subsp. sativus]